MHSNCLFWAVAQRLRHGGYVCFRRSEYWSVIHLPGLLKIPGFHVLWLAREGERFRHFVPLVDPHLRVPWYRPDLVLWFRGHIVTGDPGGH